MDALIYVLGPEVTVTVIVGPLTVLALLGFCLKRPARNALYVRDTRVRRMAKAVGKVGGVLKSQVLARAADLLFLTQVKIDWTQHEETEYGEDMRINHFCLDPIETNKFLNNGSYGATPRCITHTRQEWEEEAQRNPVKFRFVDLGIRYKEALTHLAPFVGADPSWLVFISNVNEGIASVFRSLKFQHKDVVLYLSIEYPANISLIEHLVAQVAGGVEVLAHQVDVQFPCRAADIVGLVKTAMEKLEKSGYNIKVALFDHITSATAFVLPIKELVTLCRDRGTLAVVDGAHAPGQVHLNISDIQADYYVATLHKWAFAPPGTAFLAVPPHRQGSLVPLMVGHSLNGHYRQSFFYTGHRDYSVFIVVPELKRFIDNVCGGMVRMVERNHNMVLRMAHLLADQWGDPSVVLHHPEDTACMALVVLPFGFFNMSLKKVTKFAGPLSVYLLGTYKITVPVFALRISGKPRLLVRISCHVFNEEREYQALADTINKMRKIKHLFDALGLSQKQSELHDADAIDAADDSESIDEDSPFQMFPSGLDESAMEGS